MGLAGREHGQARKDEGEGEGEGEGGKGGRGGESDGERRKDGSTERATRRHDHFRPFVPHFGAGYVMTDH